MAYCLICYCKGLSQGWSLFSSITPLAEGIFQRTGFCGLLLWSKVPEDLSNLSVRGIHASGPWQFYGTSIVTFFFFFPIVAQFSVLDQELSVSFKCESCTLMEVVATKDNFFSLHEGWRLRTCPFSCSVQSWH